MGEIALCQGAPEIHKRVCHDHWTSLISRDAGEGRLNGDSDRVPRRLPSVPALPAEIIDSI